MQLFLRGPLDTGSFEAPTANTAPPTVHRPKAASVSDFLFMSLYSSRRLTRRRSSFASRPALSRANARLFVPPVPGRGQTSTLQSERPPRTGLYPEITWPIQFARLRNLYRVMARITSSLTPAVFSLIRTSGVRSNFELEFRMVVIIMSSASFAATIWMT